MNERKLKMIEEFQCPGCVCGHDTECGHFELQEDDGGFRCSGHVPGTSMLGFGRFMLGLPIGFNRFTELPKEDRRAKISLLLSDASVDFNKFNVPVWAMVHEGNTFVRVYSPRVDWTRVVVWEGEHELPEGAVDAGEFFNEMD